MGFFCISYGHRIGYISSVVAQVRINTENHSVTRMASNTVINHVVTEMSRYLSMTEIVRGYLTIVCICHCRYGTVGAITVSSNQ